MPNAPRWVIRGSMLAVLVTLAVQVGSAVDAPRAPSPDEIAALALEITAPVAVLPALAAMLRLRLLADLRTVARLTCLALAACAGMLLARLGGPVPLLGRGHLDGWFVDLLLTSTLVVAAVGAGAASIAALREAPPREDGVDRLARSGGTVALVGGLVALCAAHLLGWPSPSSNADAVAVVATALVAMVLLTAAALADVALVLRERHRRAEALRVHVAELEGAALEQRRHRHELSNAVAAIAMASNLIHRTPDLDPDVRYRLEEMVEREAEHLTEMIAPHRQRAHAPTSAEVVDLDHTLAPVVLARAEEGREIDWVPSGLRVVGAPTDIATAVAAVIDEALASAPRTRLSIRVCQVDDTVRVAICSGAPRLWARGTTRHRTLGSGVERARRLLDAHGACLTLERGATGPTVTIGLRAPGRDQVAGATR
ncbi:hypothetical protein RDV89_05635 [Nocardioides zeae]|uniref:Signal transduction histidine kinase subgroup 3 dimerisation and phosphoacceptor domain-containing protein n=1 Tax=Nocardioides imazamoxiresistens TaxID=3231893 RepID=A0ABU3PTH3_9ACTN|nr:hypothetical protein [Nocardioides zeae]MDT9592539.1 hypothetical protein [Nocardioides zeae]